MAAAAAAVAAAESSGSGGGGGLMGRRSSAKQATSSCLVEVVLQWTPQEVSQWLESIGLPMYCHAFLEHEISGTELLSLERRDFKDVGVTKVGHLKRLQRGVKDIQHGKLPPRLLQSSSSVTGNGGGASSTAAASQPTTTTISGPPPVSILATSVNVSKNNILTLAIFRFLAECQ